MAFKIDLKMKKIYSIVILTVLFFTTVEQLSAQNKGYNIVLKLKNLPDSVCYLAQYYGDKILLQDTAFADGETFSFAKDTLLPEGMYVIAGQSNNKIVDIMLDDNQTFRVNADIDQPIAENIEFKNSASNSAFYSYVAFITEKQKEMSQLQKKYQEVDESMKEEIKNKIMTLNHEVSDYQISFAKDHKDSFAGAFVGASIQITIPDSIPTDDRKARYFYFRNHYWDYIPLEDTRMLYTPFFYEKWNTYLDKVIPQHPDSINQQLDVLLNRANDTTELYKYILWETTRKYEESKIMGFDAVFTHLALNYFKTGRSADINEQVVKNIVERGEVLNNLLLGKKSPNLIMLDSTRKPMQLHQVESDYTILIFWDSDCGHCKKEIPKLKVWYTENKEKYNAEVFSVSTDTSVTRWKAFLNKHELSWINVFGYWGYTKNFHDTYDIYSTPVIYLLDKDKAIIGKRISVPQITEIIEMEKKKKEQ